MEHLGSIFSTANDWEIYLIGNKLHIMEKGLLLDMIDSSSPAAKVIGELVELMDPKFYPSCEDCGYISTVMFCSTCAAARSW